MDEEIAKGNVVFGEDETTVPSLKSYLFEKAEQVMRSVQFRYAQKAAQEFDAIFGGTRVFDNPKNPTDLRRLLEYLTEDGALVMDFFAGSCSFAQAVLDSNSELGQNRQFICVQLPEQIDGTTNTGKNALKLGLRTVADIGKERMRRVIKRIGTSENVGFKVFGLTESNYRPWTGVDEKDAEAYGKTMKLYSDPLVAGWKPESVICEVVVKEGFSLNSRVEKLSEIKSNTVYRVSDPERGQSFRICLDDSLKPETIEALNLQQGDLFVCRDKALDDEGAANLALQCRLKTI
jgi:adenine-specific DNA-methyltransferase